MNINIIVAYSKNKGIGFENNLPWSIKSDLKKFYKLTKGNGNNAIIMGKNTWFSLNCKPLKLRDNLIISTSLNNNNNNNNNDNNNNDNNNNNNNNDNNNNNIVKYFSSIYSAIYFCKNKNYDNIWIIGGSKLYNSFLKDPNLNSSIYKIYITEINEIYKCDTFFPEISNNFRCILKKTHTSPDIIKAYDVIYINNNYSIS